MTNAHIVQVVVLSVVHFFAWSCLIRTLTGIFKEPARQSKDESEPRLHIRPLVHPEGCQRSSGTWGPLEVRQ